MFMNHLLEIGISQTNMQSNMYIQITYIIYANLWIRINWDSHRFQLDYDEVKAGWFSNESVLFWLECA